MKPLHVGLLVIGAALAGGLAVKMTQPLPLPAASAQTPAAPAVVATPAPPPAREHAAQRTVAANRDAATTPAPPPVFEEPAHVEMPRQTSRKQPLVVAKADPGPPLRPAPYEEPKPVAPPVPAPVATIEPKPEAAAAPPTDPPRQVTLQAGMPISVRLMQTLSTEHVTAGDTFQATLAEPLVVNGLAIAERGARVAGRVIDCRKAGRLSGTSMLELGLTSVQSADGQHVAISTDPWTKQTQNPAAGEAAKIGGGAVLGAIIGAIAGGGKGAAIGAGVGGGAGAGAAAVTGGKPIELPTETIVKFRLRSKVTITERQM